MHKTAPGTHARAHSAPSTAEVQRLRLAIDNMAAVARGNLAEITAIARLTLAAMETPVPHSDPELIALALRSIVGMACDAHEIIGCEVEAVGGEYDDDAAPRRLAAFNKDKAQHATPDLYQAVKTAEALLSGQKWEPSQYTPEGSALLALRAALAKADGRAAA